MKSEPPPLRELCEQNCPNYLVSLLKDTDCGGSRDEYNGNTNVYHTHVRLKGQCASWYLDNYQHQLIHEC